MKKIYKHSVMLFLLAAMVVVSSCKKTFLDKQPQDQISTTIFYKTASDAQQGLTGVYASLKQGFNGAGKVYQDCLADNAYANFNSYDANNIQLGNYATTNSTVNTVWNANYAGIAQCNLYIANVTPIAMDAATKNQYFAEVRFLRAFFYSNLINRFGDVILYDKAATLAQATTPVAKTPKAQVLIFINNDLDFAIANLPDVAFSGHVVKGSAIALKAKVALFNQDWTNAVSLTNQVITGGKFSLYADYTGLFFRKNQDNNPEIMFSTNYKAPNDQQETNGLDIEIGWWMAINPFQEMVDSYETADGKLVTDPTSGYTRAKQYVNRDPRLKASLRGADQPWYNPDGSLVTHDGNTSKTGYQMVKYIDSTLFPMGYSHTNDRDENIIHIRYADVLLMYAEAKNELSGPDASIYAVLNQIRARVHMPNVNQSLYGSQSTLRDFIRHERRIELAFEGNRYDDLIRWRTAEQVMLKVKLPGNSPPPINFDPSKNYLFPLPQNDLTINPLLKQNPGY